MPHLSYSKKWLYISPAILIAFLCLVYLSGCSKDDKGPDPSPAPTSLTCQIVTATPLNGQVPLSVTFEAAATGGSAPYTYKWSFGDGDSSTLQDATHVFSTAGTYKVILSVKDTKGTEDTTHVTISASAATSLNCAVSAGPTSGTAPLTVNFSGNASGGTSPYSYRWTFGDGTSSMSISPSHTYNSTGSYVATLTVTDSKSATCSKTVSITVGNALNCSASATPTSGPAPLNVKFTGGASGGSSPYSYAWSFGDGGTSTSPSPSHSYSTAGSYTATLIVTDSKSATCSKSVAISVGNALSCAASANPTSGTAPLPVSFTSSVSGGTSPYSYDWTFGDGGTSTSASPSHTYNSAGSYTARLTVTDSKSATCSKTIVITVSNSLSCTASANPTSGTAPLTVNFTGGATGGTSPYSYSWTFGDGGTSTSASPSHTYNSAGSYTARLTVTDAKSATCSKSITITVGGALSCSASANPTSGPAPLTVNFTGGATGGTPPYSYAWAFSDGGTSTSSSPSHTYNSAGSYVARLTVRDAKSVTCSKSVTVTVGSGLSCSASANPTSGLAPLTVNFTGGASGGTSPYSYAWTFGDGGNSTSSSPSHTYNSAGSYTATLTVKDAKNVTCTKSLSITATNQLNGPVLSGPASSTGSITLTWTFSWPPLVASGEGFSIEQSTTSPSSGFTEIAQIVRGQPNTLVISRTADTYYFRIRAYVNQGISPGWTKYSNVVTTTVSQPVSKTRFVNNSSYMIVSLVVDGVEQFPYSPLGIAPGYYYEMELSPGNHTFTMVNGFWDVSSRFEMYTLSGTVYQRSGQTEVINFNNPTINQLLTRFGSSGYWEGDFYENLVPHKAGFRFYSNGTWRLYVDGVAQSTGAYSIVSRTPSSFSVTFSVGGYNGTLYETLGYFTMRNGPSGFELIQYFYIGP